MKKCLTFIFALAMTAATASSQNSAEGFFLSYDVSSNQHNDRFSAIDMKAHYGYAFQNGFMVGGGVLGSVGLFNYGNVKTYDEALLLGVSGGYTFLNFKNRYYGSLDVRAAAHWRVSGAWKINAYDAGVYWNLGADKLFTPVIGAGCKFYDSRTAGSGNYLCFFVALGFTI